MVVSKWKKWVLAGAIGLCIAGCMSGCGKDSGTAKGDGHLKVGIVQIVQHPALD